MDLILSVRPFVTLVYASTIFDWLIDIRKWTSNVLNNEINYEYRGLFWH